MSVLNKLVKTVQALVALSKRVRPPGFAGATLYDALSVFFAEVRNSHMTERAASVAFFWLLALFPGILFLFTLIPYIPLEGFRTTLLNQMEAVLPGEAFAMLQSAIEEIVSVQRLDLLSVGLVLAFIASSNGINAIMRSLDKGLPTFKRRSFWQKRLTALMLTAMLFGVLLLSVGLMVSGGLGIRVAVESFGFRERHAVVAVSVLRWVIIFLLFFVAIAMIYRFAPARVKKWRLVSPGGTLASVLSIAASLGFTAFVNRFDVYNQVFGTIGALLATMLWMYINSLVLLIGFEINASIDRHRSVRGD